MKKTTIPLLFACCLLFSCSTPPEKYFNTAALNCNTLYGFAGAYELKRDLATPSEKLVDEKTMATAPVKRAEVVKDKLTRVEEDYANVKSLGSNAGADAMLKASTALYEYVLPVYKNEYTALATLYDEGAPAEKTEAAAKNITDKYEAKFVALYNTVIKEGMAYAEKNGIQVRQVNPSPSN